MKRGFTLIELIVVIAIIAVLAAIVAPNAFKAIEKGKVSATIADYKSIKTAAMAYYSDLGSWPSNTTDGSRFINNTDSSSIWDGPYLEKWPARAAWGGNYSFAQDNATNWDGTTGADQARYVQITGVPTTSVSKMDIQVDGSNNATVGSMRYTTSGSNATVQLLVSYD